MHSCHAVLLVVTQIQHVPYIVLYANTCALQEIVRGPKSGVQALGLSEQRILCVLMVKTLIACMII